MCGGLGMRVTERLATLRTFEDTPRSPADAFTLRVEVLVLLGISLQALRFPCEEHRSEILGRKKPMSVPEPAKIIDTQKTQRQPSELVVVLEENNVNGPPPRL